MEHSGSVRSQKGFTLMELIIVMAMFIVIILATNTVFETITKQVSQQARSVETNIEGMIGLEVLRSDLEQTGFGLFTGETTATYSEVAAGASIPGIELDPTNDLAAVFNDAPSSPPRPILSATTTFNGGSKYIVIKSTATGLTPAAKKWTAVSYDQDHNRTNLAWDSADRALAPNDQVIALKTEATQEKTVRDLVVSGTAFSSTFSNISSLLSVKKDAIYQIYGIHGAAPPLLRMPFNRSDYYIKRPSNIPRTCAPNTGILYKSVLSHSGTFTELPLVDCVADMQIVYGLDTSGAGSVNSHTDVPLTSLDDIRRQLKEIYVYVLAHEGGPDSGYRYPSSTINVGESFDGDPSHIQGRQFNLASLVGPTYANYRWKVYTIVVRPKNIIK